MKQATLKLTALLMLAGSTFVVNAQSTANSMQIRASGTRQSILLLKANRLSLLLIHPG